MQEQVTQKTQQLVKELQHMFADRLISVCVYGSAVFQDEPKRISGKYANINVIVLLKSLDLRDLEKASSIGKWWQKVGHSLPVFFSEEEWQRAADIFALEYADIKQNHAVVYGKDLFSPVDVDRDALRLVCELELHRQLIFLRQRLLLHQDKPKEILAILHQRIKGIAALFRGVLRLKLPADQVPQDAEQVFKRLVGIVDGYAPDPFLQVLASQQPKARIAATDIMPLYTRCLQQISIVTHYVDTCFGILMAKEGVHS